MLTSGANLLTLAVSGLRLGVGAPPDEGEALAGTTSGESREYAGKVVEKGTGHPIAGSGPSRRPA